MAIHLSHGGVGSCEHVQSEIHAGPNARSCNRTPSACNCHYACSHLPLLSHTARIKHNGSYEQCMGDSAFVVSFICGWLDKGSSRSCVCAADVSQGCGFVRWVNGMCVMRTGCMRSGSHALWGHIHSGVMSHSTLHAGMPLDELL